MRVAIPYGAYTLTGTVTEDHPLWVMVAVDRTCHLAQSGAPVTGDPYLTPSVCGREMPFGRSDVISLREGE